jgi:hypothetical protein
MPKKQKGLRSKFTATLFRENLILSHFFVPLFFYQISFKKDNFHIYPLLIRLAQLTLD